MQREHARLMGVFSVQCCVHLPVLTEVTSDDLKPVVLHPLQGQGSEVLNSDLFLQTAACSPAQQALNTTG
jgi:hypothetical protein